jgi:methyl-accepting chemotaxis protein
MGGGVRKMSTPITTATSFTTGISNADDSFKAGQEAAQKALNKGNVAPQFGITFVGSRYNYQEVLRGIRSVVKEAQLIGCSSAGEFTDEKVAKDSVVLALITSTNHRFFAGLGSRIKNDPQAAVKQAVSGFPKSVDGYPHLSAILLIDGLCGMGDDVCSAASSLLGPQVRYVGGAAGDDLKLKETYVFLNDQLVKDGITVGLLASKSPVAVGVKHGHCVLSEPLKVTKTKDHTVIEIDGKPAFSVWKDLTRKRAKDKGIDVDTLSSPSYIASFLLQYEGGLLTGQEYRLRAPLSVNPDGSINFVCRIEEGTIMRIMESPNQYYQIASAKQAAELAMKSAGGTKIAGAIVFDCVCRSAILNENYYKGVDAIKSIIGKVPLIGLATYGEIAMDASQLSGFHNTTTVVLLIPE